MQDNILSSKNVLSGLGSALAIAGTVGVAQKTSEAFALEKAGDKEAAKRSRLLGTASVTLAVMGFLLWGLGSKKSEK